MTKVSLPLVSAAGGHLLIPAAEVIELLRRITSDWLRAAGQETTRLDPATVTVLARVLDDLADQLDVECIGFASDTDPEEEDG